MMGVVLSAGGSLQWFRNQLCQTEMEEAKRRSVDPYELILQMVQTVPAGAEGLFFLPYLTGERHPYSDPFAKGAWIGLTVRHTRAHLARALLEGATFAMRDCLLIIRELGVSATQIRLSGGGARSPFWRQLQADIYGQKVALINAQEGPAYGVALLAMVGTGAYKSVPEACAATIQVTEELSPNEQGRRLYERIHSEYQLLYPALKEGFGRMAAMV
jgi:xylulokinase